MFISLNNDKSFVGRFYNRTTLKNLIFLPYSVEIENLNLNKTNQQHTLHSKQILKQLSNEIICTLIF